MTRASKGFQELGQLVWGLLKEIAASFLLQVLALVGILALILLSASLPKATHPFFAVHVPFLAILIPLAVVIFSILSQLKKELKDHQGVARVLVLGFFLLFLSCLTAGFCMFAVLYLQTAWA